MRPVGMRTMQVRDDDVRYEKELSSYTDGRQGEARRTEGFDRSWIKKRASEQTSKRANEQTSGSGAQSDVQLTTDSHRKCASAASELIDSADSQLNTHTSMPIR